MAPPPMPNYVRGVASAGTDTLRAIAKKFAAWQLRAPIDTALGDASALAAEYLAKLTYPEHIFGQLPKDAQDRVATAVGCVPRGAWRPAEPVPPGTPDYKRPSWEKDVYAVLFEKRSAPPPEARIAPAKRTSHASEWPELGSCAKWKKVKDPRAIADAIAKALGKGWKATDAAGDLALPRVRSTKLGLDLVAIPGGTLQMGLSPEEQRDLAKRVKGRGPEAGEHVRALAKLARPVHAVKIAPFLCADVPLVARHAKKLGCAGDVENAHAVLRVDSQTAADVVSKTGLRLLSESEWEWVARAAGDRAWLGGDEAPEAWAEETLATSLDELEHPLGVRALGWGEWIDDGWHPTYGGAPKRSEPWEPKSRPELVRGGALAQWPWQVGGELVLAHAASRDRGSPSSIHALRLAGDLPER